MMRSKAGVGRIKGARWAAQCGELIETFELEPNFSTLSDVREYKSTMPRAGDFLQSTAYTHYSSPGIYQSSCRSIPIASIQQQKAYWTILLLP